MLFDRSAEGPHTGRSETAPSRRKVHTTHLALRQLGEHVIRKNNGNVRLGFRGTFVDASSLLHVNGPYCCLLLRIGDLQLEDSICLECKEAVITASKLHWSIRGRPF
jgi:hypothetical protein